MARSSDVSIPTACFVEDREKMEPLHLVCSYCKVKTSTSPYFPYLRPLTTRNLQSIEMRNLGAPEVNQFKTHNQVVQCQPTMVTHGSAWRFSHAAVPEFGWRRVSLAD